MKEVTLSYDGKLLYSGAIVYFLTWCTYVKKEGYKKKVGGKKNNSEYVGEKMFW